MGRVRVMAMGHRRVRERFYRIFWPLSAFFVPTVQQDLLAPSPIADVVGQCQWRVVCTRARLEGSSPSYWDVS